MDYVELKALHSRARQGAGWILRLSARGVPGPQRRLAPLEAQADVHALFLLLLRSSVLLVLGLPFDLRHILRMRMGLPFWHRMI